MQTWPRRIAHDIKDWQELLVADSEGEKTLNAVTTVLINYTGAIGVSEITDDNIYDVFCRIAIMEAVVGPILLLKNKPIFLTRDDIARHFGLRTEATAIELRTFWDRMCLVNRKENSAGMREVNGGKTARSAMGAYCFPKPQPIKIVET